MARPVLPFDRWHKSYPKPHRGDEPCRCGTRNRPLYPSADHGRGLRWQARYVDHLRKEHRESFDTWQEALDRLGELTAQDATVTSESQPLRGARVAFFGAQMIERKRKKQKRLNTINTYESHLRNHILPFAGNRLPASLRRRDSMAFVDHLLEKPSLRSARTIVQIFKTWRILIHYMMDEDIPLPANIVSRIELPEINDNRVSLTPEQVAAAAVAMRVIEPRYEVVVWLGACAGLRAGEALGLTRACVGWQEDLLYVQEQRQRGKAAPLKTKASYATLPVDHFLVERLATHVANFSDPEPITQDAARKRRARKHVEPPAEGLIVTNRYGRPVQSSDFNGKWRQVVARAGLPEGSRFHDLKSFYTSTLGGPGQHDPKTVQSLSRHARFTETWDTYARPPKIAEGLTVTAFGQAFHPILQRPNEC
ncbi:tyrosine-type recombinase/integrase [Streptomyces justiciae]|uniref:tyrosine-type recombinase/integrase n=1 Tax=Streptomyces justiciae TaxID=2780140 RepID=UPI0021197773|nr:tyrosine-type recombinase/integrase [Streptomyces justiciae]MCW8382737.1 site-specific integrase [Streptomyces justiciae]